MNIRHISAPFLLALALPMAGSAQVPSEAAGCLCPVTGPCCRCADGREVVVDISTGVAPWTVRRGNLPAQAAVPNPNSNWMPPPLPANWVTPPGAPTIAGDYVYELRYVIPRCVIPATIAMTFQGSVDNTAVVSVDGNIPVGSMAGFSSLTSLTVPAAALTPGPHTLTVVVTNVGTTGPGNLTGLLVRARLVSRCPLQEGPAATATSLPDQQ